MRLPPEFLPRSVLLTPPPPAQTFIQINPTLLVSWWATGFSMAIILFRLAGRWVRTERLFVEDKIMAASIIPLLIRMGFAHVVLKYGTNNTILDELSSLDIAHRETGSRLVLPARIFYAAFLWTAKLTIAEFLRRIYNQRWKRSWDLLLSCIKWFLGITFCAIVVATLVECQPFSRYWQVAPDPGPHCRQGYAQLLTMGVADIITDLVLVGFPLPIIIKSNMPIKRKISLCVLFSLSLILVGITIYRVYGTIHRHGNQQFRSLLASLEILAATAVSNALVLGSFVRDKGVKKAKFKFGSVGGESALDRPASARTRRPRAALSWGSDIDLVGDIGIRLGPEFHSDRPRVARPAPAAIPLLDEPISPTDTGWNNRQRDSLDSDSDTDFKARHSSRNLDHISSEAHSVLTPRRMSFFDVGGLLGNDPPPASAGRKRSLSPTKPASENFSISPLISVNRQTRTSQSRGRRRSRSRGAPDPAFDGSFKLVDLKPRSRDSRGKPS
ncbi:MAG: hypothetical protein MMC23_004485 [Stictis urceolatum]|nr:hypothetical protein [Stictis urceolata]